MLLNTRIMKLKVGTTLCAGKYQIVRFINQGGFGCTYEGRHTMLNSRVAIKEFFLKDFCNRDTTTGHVTVGTLSKTEFVEKLRQRFIREAQVLNSIEHPGIVHVTDVFEENGTAYYVMNYIDGETLGELLKRRGPLPEAEAVGYIRQVCEALDYIHSRNHLHLDIKPSNIMVTREGKTVLIDFGTSKQFVENVGGVTTTNFGLTPGFAPPEQCNCETKQFCPATDLYALGATFHCMLTSETPPDVVKRASGKKFAPLPEAISQCTRKAIHKCLDLKIENRPQSVSCFLAILNNENSVEEIGKDQLRKEKHTLTIPLERKKNSGKSKFVSSIILLYQEEKNSFLSLCFFVPLLVFGITRICGNKVMSRDAEDPPISYDSRLFINEYISDTDTASLDIVAVDTIKSAAEFSSESKKDKKTSPKSDEERYRVTIHDEENNRKNEKSVETPERFMDKYTVTPGHRRIQNNGDTIYD